MSVTTTKVVRNREWEEWVVQVSEDGVRCPDADYHTDDKQDAMDTAWILSPYDTWERNPFYSGPAVPHPDDWDQDYDTREESGT